MEILYCEENGDFKPTFALSQLLLMFTKENELERQFS